MEVFIGMIGLFGFNFPPKDWAFCNGQLLSISQNSALFALLGTTYGGNGQTTFALPDLRGRTPIGMGNGPGLTPRTIGEMSGSENVTLLQTQMPQHNHLMNVSNLAGTNTSPENSVIAVASVSGEPLAGYSSTIDTTANPMAIGMAGGTQPHNNMQPYLAMNYCIALYGIFPSRN
ncbi:phage tail protein [Rudanella lutea]|uniref:phage tail protein n=1 Tax=Rudanella lutea TaxID=451374 RepID=UPI00036D809A|nr:tail fiber protein [Rudanella lutea]